MIVVRISEPEDEQQLAALSSLVTDEIRRVYRPTESAVARKKKKSQSLTRLVALKRNRIIGTVQYGIEQDRLHIIGLMVHPDYRRLGAARELIVAMNEIARSRQLRALSLYTVEQTGNVPIFEKLGFVTISRHEAVDFASEKYKSLTEFYMERDLT